MTIRDVARHAQVGVGTVSRVLNNSTAVSARTRQKVLAAIAELDYSPNVTARHLSTGRTMTIGVILPFFKNPSYMERMRGVESVLSESGFDLIIYNVESLERRNALFNSIARLERVDGLLIMTYTPDDREAERFQRANLAVVLVDAHRADFTHVAIDDCEGAYRAVRYLISLGHRKIGFISDYLESKLNFQPVRDRFLGYYQALEEAGIPFRPEYHKQGEHGRRVARKLAHTLLQQDDPPTAIFAFSDTQAVGVVEAARDLGLAVPADLSVIGFDDIDLAEHWHLTTMRQPLFETGRCGCEMLFHHLDNPAAPPQEIMLPTELVVRATTAPPA